MHAHLNGDTLNNKALDMEHNEVWGCAEILPNFLPISLNGIN